MVDFHTGAFCQPSAYRRTRARLALRRPSRHLTGDEVNSRPRSRRRGGARLPIGRRRSVRHARDAVALVPPAVRGRVVRERGDPGAGRLRGGGEREEQEALCHFLLSRGPARLEAARSRRGVGVATDAAHFVQTETNPVSPRRASRKHRRRKFSALGTGDHQLLGAAAAYACQRCSNRCARAAARMMAMICLLYTSDAADE